MAPLEVVARVRTLHAVNAQKDQIVSTNTAGSSFQPSKQVHESARLPLREFTLFPRLPPELRQMIFTAAMQQSLPAEDRIVEIHEETVDVEVTYEDNSTGTEVFQRLRSKTQRLPLFRTCHEAEGVAWRFYDKTKLLENELCLDVIPFDYEKDIAYFTQDTLREWSRLWKEYNEDSEERPLQNEEGITLRKNVRRIAFDAGVLVDAEDGARGKDTLLMEGLGQGLASFDALQEITLVIREADAWIYIERGVLELLDEEVDLSDGPLSDSMLRPDRGLSSFSWHEPQAGDHAGTWLQDAASDFRDQLDYYFNRFQRRKSRAYFKPQERKVRPVRKLPEVRVRIRDKQKL